MAAAGGSASGGVVRGLLRELRSWGRFLLPTRYVAVYYPTPAPVVRAMLRLAGVGPGDTVFDLGCGDGRIVIAAVEEFGATAGVGVELDAALAAEAAEAVAARGLQRRVCIEHRDAVGLDVSAATVLALYLSERGNRALLDGVRPGSLRPGTRVVSLHFPVEGWERWRVAEDRSSQRVGIHLYCVGGGGGGGAETGGGGSSKACGLPRGGS